MAYIERDYSSVAHGTAGSMMEGGPCVSHRCYAVNGDGSNALRFTARHTRSAVSGICTCSAAAPNPAWSSASITALTTAGVAPIVPSSPTPLAPSELVRHGIEVSNSVLKPVKPSACGSA